MSNKAKIKQKEDGTNMEELGLVLIDLPESVGMPVRHLQGNNAVQGIECPLNSKAPFTPEEEVAWQSTVEQLICRGIRNPSTISRFTGLSFAVAKRFVEQVLEGWSSSISTSLVNTRREALWQEAERVKEEAWMNFHASKTNGDDHKVLGAWLKLIVDTGVSQARLCGLNAPVKMEVETTTKQAGIKSIEDMEAEAAAKLNLPEGSLEILGAMLAKQLADAEGDGSNDK